MNNRVVHVFFDTDMRKQHPGLTEILIKNKLKPDAMMPGEHVVFVNSAMNRIKLFSHNKVLHYYFRKDGVDPRAIAEIPRSFTEHGGVSIDNATKLALEKAMERREKKKKRTA